MILLEYLNALWCAEIVDVGLFNHMHIFPASPLLYSQITIPHYTQDTMTIVQHIFDARHAIKMFV